MEPVIAIESHFENANAAFFKIRGAGIELRSPEVEGMTPNNLAGHFGKMYETLPGGRQYEVIFWEKPNGGKSAQKWSFWKPADPNTVAAISGPGTQSSEIMNLHLKMRDMEHQQELERIRREHEAKTAKKEESGFSEAGLLSAIGKVAEVLDKVAALRGSAVSGPAKPRQPQTRPQALPAQPQPGYVATTQDPDEADGLGQVADHLSALQDALGPEELIGVLATLAEAGRRDPDNLREKISLAKNLL